METVSINALFNIVVQSKIGEERAWQQKHVAIAQAATF